MIVISFQGRLQLYGDKHNIHWVPILNLVKRDYKGNERKEQNQKAAEERAERAKERRKRSIERQEVEVAEKRKHLNVSGDRVVDIHFTETAQVPQQKRSSKILAFPMRQNGAIRGL